jgi:hypothetical protein
MLARRAPNRHMAILANRGRKPPPGVPHLAFGHPLPAGGEGKTREPRLPDLTWRRTNWSPSPLLWGEGGVRGKPPGDRGFAPTNPVVFSEESRVMSPETGRRLPECRGSISSGTAGDQIPMQAGTRMIEAWRSSGHEPAPLRSERPPSAGAVPETRPASALFPPVCLGYDQRRCSSGRCAVHCRHAAGKE